MTTANATAVDKASGKTGTDKVSEKIAEKRRALGRGLESLLPGPRAVAVAPSLPQSARKDGAPGAATSPISAPAPEQTRPEQTRPSPQSSSAEFAVGRAGTPVAPSAPFASSELAVPGKVDALQASASGPALPPAGEQEQVFSLALDLIEQNPYQTRREFDQTALEELAKSIEVQGVLQPIVVRPGKEGRFILILGERRLRASTKAGKTTIPAIVKRVSEQQAAEMTLVENLQRKDLGCIDQAEAFSNLSRQFMLTQEQIGARVGVSREQVSNYMRLLTLPDGVIGALQKGILTYSHARTLLKLKNDEQIWRVAQKAMAQKMSVAKLEDLLFGVSVPGGPARIEGGARWMDPNVKAAQRTLETALGMRVRIRDRNGRGKILIEYSTLEDFDRVVGMLKGK